MKSQEKIYNGILINTKLSKKRKKEGTVKKCPRIQHPMFLSEDIHGKSESAAEGQREMHIATKEKQQALCRIINTRVYIHAYLTE